MNKALKLFTAAVAVGTVFTFVGCDGCSSCSGCNGAAAPNTITRSNWYTGTSYGGIQPSFIEDNDPFSKEQLTYKVTFSAPQEGAGNLNYSVEYSEGTFKTEFYATKFDWTGKDKAIPDGYADKDVGSELVYVYKTTFDISGKFTMKVGDKGEKEFTDHVVTESWFRAAGKNLQPVYSKQTLESTSPANLQPMTITDACMEVNAVYENFYDYNCTKVLSKNTDVKTGKTETKEYSNLGKLSNVLFDNSSLYIVARSFLKTSSAVSQYVCLFNAVAGGADTYAVAGSDSPLTVSERKEYTDILSDNKLFNKKNDEDRVSTTAVSVSYAGGNLHGTAQTVWYAAVTDADNNVSRSTMLKLSVPISFSLGTLNYSLKEITSTLW